MTEKFKKLLTKLNKLPLSTIDEIREELYESKDFYKFVKNTKDFTWEEHDGLLKLLDFKKKEGYFRDKYNKKVSYNNIATLKSPGTEMDINHLHEIEIEKVKNDYHYFKRLYAKIATRTGVSRAEARQYQLDLDNAFVTGDDLCVSFSRQSGKTVGSACYILHSCLSRKDQFNAGIVGNTPSTASEVLDKVKKILVELPIWMSPCMDTWNKQSIEFENGTRIMTSRPHGDAFRGFTISLLYCDETAYYKHNEWEAFKDSVFPTMASLITKQSIFTSTAKGLNHWATMVKGARAGTNGYKIVENSWKDVPRYNKKGILLTPEQYREKTIEKYGEKFFKSTEENAFIGSTTTLIDGDVLQNLITKQEKTIPEIFHKIKVFEEVKKGHSYAIGVDPSGDGIDNFGIQVVDITNFPFEQVASGALQVDYMIMAEHLAELGEYYNEAFITVETNDGIGTSIVDALWYTYEYPNLFRERDDNNKGYKKRHGFRTTQKTRRLILSTMKTFIEEDKLKIHDSTTIDEFFTFELDDKGKYVAADGSKDDMVMSLAITFAPFTHIKVMDDHKLYLQSVRAEVLSGEEGTATGEFYSMLDVGGGFDDGSEGEDLSQYEQLQLADSIIDEDEKFEELRKANTYH